MYGSNGGLDHERLSAIFVFFSRDVIPCIKFNASASKNFECSVLTTLRHTPMDDCKYLNGCESTTCPAKSQGLDGDIGVDINPPEWDRVLVDTYCDHLSYSDTPDHNRRLKTVIDEQKERQN